MHSKDLIELWDMTGGQLHDLLDQELLIQHPTQHSQPLGDQGGR